MQRYNRNCCGITNCAMSILPNLPWRKLKQDIQMIVNSEYLETAICWNNCRQDWTWKYCAFLISWTIYGEDKESRGHQDSGESQQSWLTSNRKPECPLAKPVTNAIQDNSKYRVHESSQDQKLRSMNSRRNNKLLWINIEKCRNDRTEVTTNHAKDFPRKLVIESFFNQQH
jgi:hypothetical protein